MKKGFTLIELLAVLALLGVIILVSVQVLFLLIKNPKKTTITSILPTFKERQKSTLKHMKKNMNILRQLMVLPPVSLSII